MRLDDGWWIPDFADPQKSHPIKHQQGNDIKVIDKALAATPGRKIVIQAGCRLGLWPKTLAQHFGMVYTFEPEQDNYDCAAKNLEGLENVNLYHAALGEKQRDAFIEINAHSGAGGSHQVVDTPVRGTKTQPTVVMTIDSLLINPDLIMLDIEGYEMYALLGARHTIKRCSPIIVIEQNDAMLRYGVRKPQIGQFLDQFNYVPVDRQYKDTIYARKEPECTATE